MEQRFEEAAKRVQEHNLADLIFHKKYSDDENLQNAFLDGYAVGVLSSLFVCASNKNEPNDTFGENRELLKKAINGDKEAIQKLEYLISNKK